MGWGWGGVGVGGVKACVFLVGGRGMPDVVCAVSEAM